MSEKPRCSEVSADQCDTQHCCCCCQLAAVTCDGKCTISEEEARLAALDAARRAGKAEGLREGAKLLRDRSAVLLSRANGNEYEVEYHHGKALDSAADVLLARAEEVER